ncbi:hypothetical protein [Synechococcus sp. BA-132 BA5]|uniref:hypothetical protein n=1 Tax=Synechococcus sp. BA-132 BA5 TaxID=3110252 RepID=UPI002B21E795|nr:hypothetical protein [Synechococcus sp. BA-132 BA5]MEA5416626.1 hypothetical protein [Synechococcus sp. BA-132 BA5]
MNPSPMVGQAAQGPLPAGMLRIRLGHQERYVWPVHLPGWLALGWRVAGAKATAGAPSGAVAAAEPPAPIAAAAGELLEQDDAKPAATRGRRGRRRKEEQEQPPVVIEATPEQTGTIAEAGAAEAESPVATDLAPEPGTDSGDDSAADGELALTALPDDLFADPLI